MPLAFDKRRGRSFNSKKSSFLSAKSNIKQVTINMHSNKVFKEIWYAWYATQIQAYDMHDLQTTWGHMNNIKYTIWLSQGQAIKANLILIILENIY